MNLNNFQLNHITVFQHIWPCSHQRYVQYTCLQIVECYVHGFHIKCVYIYSPGLTTCTYKDTVLNIENYFY